MHETHAQLDRAGVCSCLNISTTNVLFEGKPCHELSQRLQGAHLKSRFLRAFAHLYKVVSCAQLTKHHKCSFVHGKLSNQLTHMVLNDRR